MNSSYESTIEYLYGLQKHGIKLGLENTRRLLAALGNPQGSFRSAHLAGTNGKGSTAAALEALLRRSGERTGLFTSPHLVSFTERIVVDGVRITEEEVISYAQTVREKAAVMNPTFFEVVTALAFRYFAERSVRWAVVETGLGGRLDSTNVLEPVLTVITNIATDHQEFLGRSIEEIAAEKAGIIKPGVPVVTSTQEPAAMRVIEERATSMGSPLYAAGRDFSCEVRSHGRGRVVFDYSSAGGLALEALELPLSGKYQASNASLALKALELTGIELGAAAIREALGGMRWPGRLEVVSEEPLVLLDGAHNPAASRAMAEALREDWLAEGQKIVLVMGVMADKDAEGIMAPLLPLASEVIFAAPAYARAAPAEALVRQARALGRDSTAAASVAEALGRAMAKRSAVVVTGSFFTIGEAKEALGIRGPLRKLGEWQAAP